MLADNEFTGFLPEDIGNLVNLETLDASGNFFTGRIPLSFGNLLNLLIVSLSDNYFAGPLPEDWSKLTGLVEISMHTNFASNDPDFGLTGSIPTSLGLLSNLIVLELHENK